ncbi:hypothetical protein LRR80_06673 [Streptomyces sp. RO-S4]|uniref:FAD binding domain-containing protein n=1 Tax=unclassified Streptomyces TaxID=2593676 RepID=UPI00203B2EE6|nr:MULTISPECIES: FAD binding domain-containing protein [unclassified Streptomyces]MCO4700563.1 hypothetical protein [Streptomyces sp. RO-S4]
MRPFEYVRPARTEQAVAAVTADPRTSFLAGGTTQLDLMKDGVLEPERLVDISRRRSCVDAPSRSASLTKGSRRAGTSSGGTYARVVPAVRARVAERRGQR